MTVKTPTKLSKGEKSRVQIIEASKPLIASRGFNAITLQEILDTAAVTKGKFFHHFKTKEDFFGAVLRYALAERVFPLLQETVKTAPDTSPLGTFYHSLDQMIEWHQNGLPEGMRLCVLATFFFGENSAEITRIREKLQSNVAFLESLLKKAQQEGSLPSELPCDLFGFLIPSASVGGYTVGYLHGRKPLAADNLRLIKKIINLLEIHPTDKK